MLVHEKNILEKIRINYKGAGAALQAHYNGAYLQYKNRMEAIDFRNKNITDFDTAAQLLTAYYSQAKAFADLNNITSQSKFLSTVLEEINHFLFSAIATNNGYKEFNSKVFAGLVFDENDDIVVNEKNVDYCIGKEIKIEFKKGNKTCKKTIKKPIVAVEVKTYLDATMFSGIRTFSADLKRGSMDCSTYVLMAYRNIDPSHIRYAKGGTDLNEMFVLCADENCVFDGSALLEYYKEIEDAIVSYNAPNQTTRTGRLLNI